MQHLEFSGAVRPLKWSLDVKWLKLVNEITLNRVAWYDRMIPCSQYYIDCT